MNGPPCKYCKRPTVVLSIQPAPGVKPSDPLCSGCWELESRVRLYDVDLVARIITEAAPAVADAIVQQRKGTE